MKDLSLLKDRLDICRNALDFKKVGRTPTISTATTWQIYDSKYKVQEVYYDYKKMEEVICDYQNRYGFDCHMYSGAIYAFPVLDALGGGSYRLDPVTGAMSVGDDSYMNAEDYLSFAEDPAKHMRDSFARKFPDMSTERFASAISKFLDFGRWAKKSPDVFKNILQTPMMYGPNYMTGIEFLNASVRGIKDISLDMRRNKEALKTYVDAQWAQMTRPNMLATKNNPHSDATVVDFGSAMLAHALMNIPQFETFYYPQLKEMFDFCKDEDKTMFIFCENAMLRLSDYFRDIDKGRLILHLEYDDPAELRKVLPNLCIAGGFPIEMSGTATPEQCADKTKQLIDMMEYGYILGLSKVAAYKNDATRENLMAIMETCRNYK